MSPQIKLALRRFALRWLRKLVDVVDDRLHAAEVQLREEISASSMRGVVGTVSGLGVAAVPASNTYAEWEARRSGVAPVSKKETRKRRERAGAAAFDLRFAR